MPRFSTIRAVFGLGAWLLALATALDAQAAGPKVPEGFECRLVATVPAVEYPCQVATAPDGSLFVAEDPMDQIGPYEAFNGRILRFVDGKDPIVFADGFRSVQGMAWRGDALYVCHMPFLTVVRDKDGDGKAEEKTVLFKDLGQTKNQGLNDHIVSGIQFGMDGWLYISVGDKGIPLAHGPDGKTVSIEGGGVVRCRPDGTEIEIVSYGTRNHLEANLDDLDNIFTYDNTDDGLGWWTRVTHHIDSGYYGYPFDYHDFQYRMLPRMAEYGGGSPCGAVFYKEDAWPLKYRNVGYWAEWGKGKVHAFKFEPAGATYKVAEEIDFALPGDSANFRPIDLAVSDDGKTMYIADWNMGGWGSKTEKVGRVWAVTWKGESNPAPRGKDSDPIEAQINALSHPAHAERMRAQYALIAKGKEAVDPVIQALLDEETSIEARRHLLWTLDAIAGGTPTATTPTLKLFSSPNADLRAQAARAMGLRKVPIAAEPLIGLVKDADPNVRLQAAIALGRIGDAHAASALSTALADPDSWVAFAARQALRRINDWEPVAVELQSSGDAKLRDGILMTLELVYDAGAAKALAQYAADRSKPSEERAKALLYLSSVIRKRKPWDGKWWGTRPYAGKPPAKVDDWEGTPIVLDAIRSSLTDPELALRASAVSAVKSTGEKSFLSALRERFVNEPDVDLRRDLALTLGTLEDHEALPLLVTAIGDGKTPEPLRDAALTGVETIGGDLAVKTLIDVLGKEDVPAERQPRLIAALARFKAASAVPVLLTRSESTTPAVRVAAVDALGAVGTIENAAPRLRKALDDDDLDVRKAALKSLGKLKDMESIPAFLDASRKEDTRFEASMALAALPDVRSLQVYLAGLTDRNQDLRNASAAALGAIRDAAVPILEQLSSRHELPGQAIPELVKIYTGLQPIERWRVLGPFSKHDEPAIHPEGSIDLMASHTGLEGKPARWRRTRAIDPQGQVDLGKFYMNNDTVFAFGYAEINSETDRKARLAVGSDDTLTVWLNGKKVYEFLDRRGYSPDVDRVDVDLVKGANRVLVKCGNEGGGWQYSVALTASNDYAFLKDAAPGAFNPEEFREFALKNPGKAEHGQALFADLKGLACAKCHAVKGQGGAVGPDLSGVGATYPKEELIASVLYPSQKIFSGYEPIIVATNDGQIVTGILKRDAPDEIEIQDAEAKSIVLKTGDIDERKKSDVSLMPSGLAEGLSKQDFADVIAYLESLKDKPAEAKVGK